MAKRRPDTDPESLPLFDLPLHDEPHEAPATTAAELLGEPIHEPLDEPLGEPPGEPVGEPRLPFDGEDERAEPVARDGGPTELRDETDEEAQDPDADPVAAGNPVAAGMGGRLVAGLVDLGAQLAALAGTGAVAYALGARPGVDDLGAFALLALVFSFLYWTVPLAFWGQTPGMTVCGHLARTGDDEPLTFGQTARRWLGALLTLALAGLPLLLALGGRSLTDLVSGTRTVRLD